MVVRLTLVRLAARRDAPLHVMWPVVLHVMIRVHHLVLANVLQVVVQDVPTL